MREPPQPFRPRFLAPRPRFILITGIAGSGKTTIGSLAAAELSWPYFEADDFHSLANRTKMANGIPLDDADRLPWLESIRKKMDEVRAKGGYGIFTCSALKAVYRDVILKDTPNDVMLVYLHGDPMIIMERVSRRQGHYMKADMVKSQLRILEVPAGAFIIDVREEVTTQVARIVGEVLLPPQPDARNESDPK